MGKEKQLQKENGSTKHFRVPDGKFSGKSKLAQSAIVSKNCRIA